MDIEQRKCRICGVRLAIKNRQICGQCKHVAAKEIWRGNYESYIGSRLRYAKSRAKKRGIPFDIDTDFILELLERQEHKCSMTGLPFTRTGNHADYDLSIDRLDSDLGYSKDNVVLVCNRANNMKNNLSPEMFIWWCKTVANHDEERKSRKKNNRPRI